MVCAVPTHAPVRISSTRDGYVGLNAAYPAACLANGSAIFFIYLSPCTCAVAQSRARAVCVCVCVCVCAMRTRRAWRCPSRFLLLVVVVLLAVLASVPILFLHSLAHLRTETVEPAPPAPERLPDIATPSVLFSIKPWLAGCDSGFFVRSLGMAVRGLTHTPSFVDASHQSLCAYKHAIRTSPN